ncbi:MAG TPA: hypothetical protein VL524_10485 [Gemmatimonadaceae bacterium]|nr:hypothetical protein [Gemmatimonadaceae bacterium]
MRIRNIASAIAVLVTLTACDTLPTAPTNQASARTLSASRAASRSATPSASSPACKGAIVEDRARNWPWAHSTKSDFFAPPPGGMAEWLQLQGESIGVASVSELQDYYCGD